MSSAAPRRLSESNDINEEEPEENRPLGFAQKLLLGESSTVIPVLTLSQ